MVLGKVIGTVVATIKHPSFKGRKNYIIQPLTATLEPIGDTFLAFDTVQSGVGDTVLVLREGGGSRQITGTKDVPIRSLVVGIVDEVDLCERREA